MHSIVIAGGDMRQVKLSGMLKEKGYTVHITGFEKLGIDGELPITADWVFLPVPYKTPDGYLKAPYAQTHLELSGIVERYPTAAYMLGGADAQTSAHLAGTRVFDLLADEAFLVYNAMLTAQGAVLTLLKDSETALYGAKCVVTGWGRIAKLLCRLLKAHVSRVTAVARKYGDLEFIRAEGMEAAHMSALPEALEDADAVFNTVPERIFYDETLKCIPRRAQVIELASPPYGMDIARAKEIGLNARIEAGLPGRCFPVSAAEAMLRAFEREEGLHGTGR